MTRLLSRSMRGKGSNVEKDYINRWIRSLERQLELRGHERVNRRLLDTRMPSSAKSESERKEIFEMLMRDSLLWSFEELGEGRAMYAFRGFVQAGGYAGVCGHDPVTSDAWGSLKNCFEDLILAGEKVSDGR